MTHASRAHAPPGLGPRGDSQRLKAIVRIGTIRWALLPSLPLRLMPDKSHACTEYATCVGRAGF